MNRRWLPWSIVAVLGATGLPSACDAGGVVGGECIEGLTVCNGQCVNLSNDSQNCGACGHTCSADRACALGTCSETDGGEPDAADASNDTFDSADVQDANVDGSNDVSSDVNGDVLDDGTSDAPSDGGGDACVPPFNTPQHCGDCFTQCTGTTPLCGPSDGGFACKAFCDPPLTQCGNECVDLTSDPANCGKCGNVCPSGLCQGGICVGATVGHVVLACMDYDQSFQNSPQTVLLGNAVFLKLVSLERILSYDEFATETSQKKVDQTIAWAATARSRTYSNTTVSTVSEVAAMLNILSFDVFLVYDQRAAPPGKLAQAGSTLSSKLDSFGRAGGTIIVLSSGKGTAEMDSFMTAAGLMPISAEVDATKGQLYNRAPGDAVGINVISPFLALKTSCTFTTSVTPDSNTVFVITDSGGPSLGRATVVHRIVAP